MSRLIALAIVVLAAATAVIVFRPHRLRAALAWLADARDVLTDMARGLGRGHGLHVLPAGETPEDLPDPRGASSGIWPQAGELEPLPEYDEGIAVRERYRRLAWAATGTTEAAYHAEHAPDRVDDLVAVFAATGRLPLGATFRDGQTGVRDLDSPAGGRSPESGSLSPRRDGETPAGVTAGRATPNQRQLLWQPRELAPHVVAALTGARPDETVIEHNHATLEPYIIGLAGGDPFDGLGQDEWLDRLFYRPLAGAR